jgi:putative transposase
MCAAVDVPASTFYRHCKPEDSAKSNDRARARSLRALSEEERQRVLCVLHEERFVDKAPTEVYAALLDEGIYLCSIRTMYRILHENNEVKERRNILRHPQYEKPELLATGPNQVWSWDITKLKGPVKWHYYYLYVIIDIFSRHAVGWMVAHRENAELAKLLIGETCMRQGIDKDQLLIHSDRGSPMTSKAVALLMSDLGVTKSLSRPHVSNDNPFSESQFKTLKYCPTFPKCFGSIEDARAFCQRFFDWYNNEHYHTGISLMTPAMVHYGAAEECSRQRQIVLSAAFEKHPERFVAGSPKVLELPKEVWINPPKPAVKAATQDSITIINAPNATVL